MATFFDSLSDERADAMCKALVPEFFRPRKWRNPHSFKRIDPMIDAEQHLAWDLCQKEVINLHELYGDDDFMSEEEWCKHRDEAVEEARSEARRTIANDPKWIKWQRNKKRYTKRFNTLKRSPF